MAGDMVQVRQMCGICGSELGTFEVKKENLMLSSKAFIWCPNCQKDTPEIRDMVGRLNIIEEEAASMPKSDSY